MTAVEILVAARELIAVEERWTQGVAARRADGSETGSEDSDAAQWCMWGAYKKCRGNTGNAEILYAVYHAIDEQTPYGFAHFNDNHTHAEVLAAFDRAIAKLRGEA